MLEQYSRVTTAPLHVSIFEELMKYRKWRLKRKRVCTATTWKVEYTPSNGESPFLNNTFEPYTIQRQVRSYSKHELTLDILRCLDRNDLTNTNLKLLHYTKKIDWIRKVKRSPSDNDVIFELIQYTNDCIMFRSEKTRYRFQSHISCSSDIRCLRFAHENIRIQIQTSWGTVILYCQEREGGGGEGSEFGRFCLRL